MIKEINNFCYNPSLKTFLLLDVNYQIFLYNISLYCDRNSGTLQYNDKMVNNVLTYYKYKKFSKNQKQDIKSLIQGLLKIKHKNKKIIF